MRYLGAEKGSEKGNQTDPKYKDRCYEDRLKVLNLFKLSKRSVIYGDGE